MAKNLVICLDGTANEFGKENTNVVRLYQALPASENTQLTYYDPGVGTMGQPGMLTQFGQKFTQFLGLAFGLGVTQNVINAYRFLMRYYSKDDQIYIFGFSRGALEARALAGLIYRCGLLKPELSTLVPYALRIFRTIGNWKVADDFQATFSRPVRVHFLGLWDTVTSFGNVWTPIHWPHVTHNPGVDKVRHAIALDERRAFFRQNRWAEGDATAKQDVRERWFIGVHCDVGGGYIETESALWTVTLHWMVDEAEPCGLKIDRAKLEAPINAARSACTDPHGNISLLHDSMAGLGPVWYITELIPRRRWLRKTPDGTDRYEWIWPVWRWFGEWLFNRGQMGRARAVGRPRILKGGDRVHRSVFERFATDPTYRPDPLLKIGITEAAAQAFVAGSEGHYEVPRQNWEDEV